MRTTGPCHHGLCDYSAQGISGLGEVDLGSGDRPEIGDSTTIQRLCQDVNELVKDVPRTLLELVKELAGKKGESTPPQESCDLFAALLAADMPARLVALLPWLEFDVRNIVTNVIGSILWPEMPAMVHRLALQYLRGHEKLFGTLVHGFGDDRCVTYCAAMLRSCARHKELVETFFAGGHFLKLLRFAAQGSFEVSSEAFRTCTELLLRHKAASAAWLEDNTEEVFEVLNGCLAADEYVRQRQAVALLTRILLDLSFQRVMLAYVRDARHLQLVMNLFRRDSRALEVDAFHLLKLFVADPHKGRRVHAILHKNRAGLLRRVGQLAPKKPGDSFRRDQCAVLELLGALGPPS